MLFGDSRELPMVPEFEGTFRAALGLPEADIEYEAEFFDVPRFGPDASAMWRDFLKRKYAGRDVRVVVAMSGTAFGFLIDHQAELFPGLPIVICGVLPSRLASSELPPNFSVVPFTFDFARTVEIARQLQPDATEVVVPVGTSEVDLRYAAFVRNELPVRPGALPVRYLENMPVEAILEDLSGLNAKSIALLIPYFRDSTGRDRPAMEFRQRFVAASGAPLYTASSSNLGTGVVGGQITTFAQMGEQTGDMARRVLAGETLPPTVSATESIPIVDWRALQRWGLDESRLAAGVEVRFKPLTLWEERKGLIVTVIAVVLLQAASLMALLIQRRRRDAAEVQAHAHRNDLAHLGRVSLMGELSASFAHELNQPLTAILSNAQAAQRFLKAPNPDLDSVGEILADIASDDRRAADVIQRLREMMKKGQPKFEVLDCHEVVESVLRLAAKDLLNRGVRVTLELPPALKAKADRVQLQQVLLNLIMNAADAVREAASANRRILIRVMPRPSDTVELIVSDRGGGIPEEQLHKVFEPFYTTKSEGLGMGLSICRTLVEAHGGRMWASNNPEGGASLHLVLPAG